MYNREVRMIEYLNERLFDYNIEIKSYKFTEPIGFYEVILHLQIYSGYSHKTYNKLYSLPRLKRYSITLYNKLCNSIIYDVYSEEKVLYKERKRL